MPHVLLASGLPIIFAYGWAALLVQRYLSNTTSFVLCAVYNVKDRNNCCKHISHFCGKPERRVVLDKRCIHICVYIYIYTCIHICIYVCIYIYIHTLIVIVRVSVIILFILFIYNDIYATRQRLCTRLAQGLQAMT